MIPNTLYLILVLLAVVAVVVLVCWLYWHYFLRGHLDVFATAMDKPAIVNDAETFTQRLNAKLLGWKTIILAAVAAVTQGVPAFLDTYLPTLRDAPWAQVIDQKVAGWISFVCVLLIPIVHAQGLAKAAQTPPAA